MLPRLTTADQLRSLAQAPSAECQCVLRRCAGWDSVSEAEWSTVPLKPVATLRDTELLEPTFEEYHPNGTRYEDPRAPVSLPHFPTNRCDVHACQRCGQHVLRYTEFGGYYVDPRARRLDPALIAGD